ncbi:MAG TPA: alpha/beta fold hydrolase [Marmoricola sp.]|nr:alpha/beta fold hydrolase [Marmoricola sp.]
MSQRLMVTGPDRPRGLVLMLHGGAEHSERPVDGRSLSLRRTQMMYAALAPRVADAGCALGLLRFTLRGWNARLAEPSPLADARWALDRVRERHPGLPVVLLGHSMGARAAVHVADHEQVVGVVGLAPWLPADEPVQALAGRHVVAAHGKRDRITSARQTRTFLERAGLVAASTEFVDMGLVGHYMLTHVRAWNRAALRAALGMLADSS